MSEMTFKYAGSTLVCDGNLQPGYAQRDGEQYFTFALDRPEYTSTTRDHPEAEVDYDFRRLLSADRGDLWAWWNTELEAGRNIFTVIDHHRRLLFDITWDEWRETWRRDGRGVWDVPVSLVSPYGWSPRTHALYPMLASGSTIADHLLTTGNDMTLGADGSLVNKAADAAVLRGTGYALKMQENEVTAPAGASGTPSYTREGGDGSIAVFCQVYLPVFIETKVCRIVRIAAGSQYIEITATGTSGSDSVIAATWDNGTGAQSLTALTNFAALTWYDVCVTYDAVNGKASVYAWPSADAAMWIKTDNYLDALTATTGHLDSATAATFPVPTTWTSIVALHGTTATIIGSDTPRPLLQNVWILDSFVPPRYFNTMRRLCHNWNFQTVWVYPL